MATKFQETDYFESQRQELTLRRPARMFSEKRNKYLDADDSDDDLSQGYNSEEVELKKGRKSAKRWKIEDHSDEEDVAEEEDDLSSLGDVEDQASGELQGR